MWESSFEMRGGSGEERLFSFCRPDRCSCRVWRPMLTLASPPLRPRSCLSRPAGLIHGHPSHVLMPSNLHIPSPSFLTASLQSVYCTHVRELRLLWIKPQALVLTARAEPRARVFSSSNPGLSSRLFASAHFHPVLSCSPRALAAASPRALGALSHTFILIICR